MNLVDEVLPQIVPDAAERERVADLVRRLEADVQRSLQVRAPGAQASIQGSMAKDTWTKGAGDVDLFILFPQDADEQTLHDVTRDVADDVLADARRRYAQHPYAIGTYDGMEVDLVPAYRVGSAGDHMSAVDRTPFHTAWVNGRMTPELRDQVRLAKKWLKGVGSYGAETAIGGFSGYLVEVLISVLGSFDDLLRWLAAGAQPRRIAVDADRVDDDVSPLIVVDPVDPTRNCAAAVSIETLDATVAAAQAFLAEPTTRFFFPAAPRAEDGDALRERLEADNAVWLGWTLPDVPERLDIVFPQYQKACGRIRQALADAGFQVRQDHTWCSDSMVAMQWLLDGEPLPASRVHRGPPATAGPNAQKFTDKWAQHPDAMGPATEVDGRLQVEVRINERTPSQWLRRHLDAMPLGKHVEASRRTGSIDDDPGAVGPPWSPIVADFILQRRPWER